MLKTLLFFSVILIYSSVVYTQEVDITSALNEIESGNIQTAAASLKELKKNDPNNPSVIFLDAVLTKDGDEALKKYSVVYEKFPKSKYADAALYRIFSYYYSLGIYKKAEYYLTKLKNEFPNSSYITAADRSIPDEEDGVSSTTQDERTYHYTIQAGAFLNTENAQKLVDEFLKDNLEAEIAKKEIGGSEFNIVNVGKFKNEDEVNQFLKVLSEKYHLNGRIVPLN